MKIEITDNLKVEEYNELRQSIGWDTKDYDVIEKAFKNSCILKKATIEDKTVGMARVIGDGIYYLIVDVVVHKEHQGLGIGKILIEEIVKEIDSRTTEGHSCNINLISMEGKEPFYEKCGFKKIPEGYTGSGMIRRIKK